MVLKRWKGLKSNTAVVTGDLGRRNGPCVEENILPAELRVFAPIIESAKGGKSGRVRKQQWQIQGFTAQAAYIITDELPLALVRHGHQISLMLWRHIHGFLLRESKEEKQGKKKQNTVRLRS